MTRARTRDSLRLAIKYTENNIKEINNMATLMTMDEIEAFIEDDYSYLLMS